MITILTYISLIAGGILILLMLLSLLGGLDLDLDIGSSTDVDTDAGGVGLIKGALTFISVSSWIIKVLLASNKHIGVALGIGILAGLAAIIFLSYIFKLLLKNDSNVNWKIEDAMFESGEVYLKIPSGGGSGIVNVNINGVQREIKALSNDNQEIKTGTPIKVLEIDGEYVKVQAQDNF